MRLLTDILIVVASVFVAIFIVQQGLVESLLELSDSGNILIASFVAGIFFTSVFTTAPSVVVLGELAQHSNLFLIAIVGGVGSVIGDYVLFVFVRKRLAADAELLMKGLGWRHALKILKRHRFRRLLSIVGAIFLVSPLPDEPGLALLGVSSIRTSSFLLLTFALHAVGIVLIGIVARLI